MLHKIIFYYEKILLKSLCNWTYFVKIYFEGVDEHKSDDPMFK